MKVLDVGCGVGGPAREIATFSGCHVTGLNNNAYQASMALLRRRSGAAWAPLARRSGAACAPLGRRLGAAFALARTLR